MLVDLVSSIMRMMKFRCYSRRLRDVRGVLKSNLITQSHESIGYAVMKRITVYSMFS
jgi:hypothetical protein